MHSFPTCKYRLKNNVCGYACQHTGFKISVSPVLCSVSCSAWGGPQKSNNLTKTQTSNFLRKMLELQFSGGGSSLGTWSRSWASKVLSKYVVSTQLVKPSDCILDCVKKLSSELKANRSLGVTRVCLTGSVITNHHKRPKDLDICVVTDNLLEHIETIEKLVPSEICGLKTDVFVMAAPSSFFVCLDVDTFELFMSVKAKIVGTPDEYTVRTSTGHWGWVDQQVLTLIKAMEKSTSSSLDRMLEEDAKFSGCCSPPQK